MFFLDGDGPEKQKKRRDDDPDYTPSDERSKKVRTTSRPSRGKSQAAAQVSQDRQKGKSVKPGMTVYQFDKFTNQVTIPPGQPFNPTSQAQVFTVNESTRSKSQPPISVAASARIKQSQVKVSNVLKPLLDDDSYERVVRDSNAALNTERSQNRRNRDVPTLGTFTESEEEAEDLIPQFVEEVVRKPKPSPFAQPPFRRRRSSSRDSASPQKSRKSPPRHRGKHKKTPSPKRSSKRSKRRSPTPEVFSSDGDDFVERDLEDTDSQESSHSRRSSRGSKVRRSPKRHSRITPRDDVISPRRDENGLVDFKYIDLNNRIVSLDFF